MMSLWDALRMNMMISYQELVRTFPKMKEANAVLLMDKFIYYLKQHRLYTRTLGII